MKVLVTAGNTRVPIDQVRGIDNIFKGRTGAGITKYFAEQGCDVTLLTSHPTLVGFLPNLHIRQYDSYNALVETMEILIRQMDQHDIVIHSAAVSDYRVDGMYEQICESPATEERLVVKLNKLDSSGKIGSNHEQLWMKMIPTMKIVDQMRDPWGFRGTLVKFKLQVGMGDEELINIATRSMKHSNADFIVANTLEGMSQKAFIIKSHGGNPMQVNRDTLPTTLFQEIFR